MVIKQFLIAQGVTYWALHCWSKSALEHLSISMYSSVWLSGSSGYNLCQLLGFWTRSHDLFFVDSWGPFIYEYLSIYNFLPFQVCCGISLAPMMWHFTWLESLPSLEELSCVSSPGSTNGRSWKREQNLLMEKLLRKCWKMKTLWCWTRQKSQSKNWILAFDAIFFCLYHPDLLLLKLDFYFLAEDIIRYWSLELLLKLQNYYKNLLYHWTFLTSLWIWSQATFSRYLKFRSFSVYVRSDSVCEENIFLIHQNWFLEMWKLFFLHWPGILQWCLWSILCRHTPGCLYWIM